MGGGIGGSIIPPSPPKKESTKYKPLPSDEKVPFGQNDGPWRRGENAVRIIIPDLRKKIALPSQG